MEQILSTMARDRQIMLFSATMPDKVKALAHRYMTNFQHVIIKTENITLDNIQQRVVDTVEDSKLDKLCELINEQNPYLAMVFVVPRAEFPRWLWPWPVVGIWLMSCMGICPSCKELMS